MTAVLLLMTATRTIAGEPHSCADVRDTVLNARNALQAYYSANGEYPEQLSGISFNPPEHIVVIYEKMTVNPPQEIYMVRAYRANCGTMYLATPASPGIHEVPISADSSIQNVAKPVPMQTRPITETSDRMPFVGSLAAFFTVFILIVLIFYIRNKKSVSSAASGKGRRTLSNGGE